MEDAEVRHPLPREREAHERIAEGRETEIELLQNHRKHLRHHIGGVEARHTLMRTARERQIRIIDALRCILEDRFRRQNLISGARIQPAIGIELRIADHPRRRDDELGTLRRYKTIPEIVLAPHAALGEYRHRRIQAHRLLHAALQELRVVSCAPQHRGTFAQKAQDGPEERIGRCERREKESRIVAQHFVAETEFANGRLQLGTERSVPSAVEQRIGLFHHPFELAGRVFRLLLLVNEAVHDLDEGPGRALLRIVHDDVVAEEHFHLRADHAALKRVVQIDGIRCPRCHIVFEVLDDARNRFWQFLRKERHEAAPQCKPKLRIIARILNRIHKNVVCVDL
mmetsp:Transcript_140/g.260  ORF Transcript_140/g.260 Transcript_140/m.260 type:complete len:341 (-) Transcript_140:387-1409(-)